MRPELFIPGLPLRIGHNRLHALLIFSKRMKTSFQDKAISMTRKIRQNPAVDSLRHKTILKGCSHQCLCITEMPELKKHSVANNIHGSKFLRVKTRGVQIPNKATNYLSILLSISYSIFQQILVFAFHACISDFLLFTLKNKVLLQIHRHLKT